MAHTTTAGRRPLSFATLDAVMPDVDGLLQGHRTVGTWSLGQICNHLAGPIIGSVDGFPEDVKAPWLLRVAVAPVVLRSLFKSGRMPEGIKVPEKLLPKPALDDRAEAEALRAALRLFTAHEGPTASHPFFGRMNRSQWDQLHRIHCAHHLSFVLPSA
jgi:hypothetical protein